MITHDVSVIPPGGTMEVTLKKPILDTQEPIVVTQTPGDVVITGVSEDRKCVYIRNATEKRVGYILLVVPRIAVSLAKVPWGDIKSGFKGFLERLAERKEKP